MLWLSDRKFYVLSSPPELRSDNLPGFHGSDYWGIWILRVAFGERCKGSTDELATFNIENIIT
jgi:hypothetical protein